MKRRVFIDGKEVKDLRSTEWRAFQKKPVTIQARQMEKPFAVDTLEGIMQGVAGDWLISGVEGELYPCKDRIFKATYREAK